MEEEHYNLCGKNKGADQLICVFVFVYAKCWFSHAKAHFINVCKNIFSLMKKKMKIYNNMQVSGPSKKQPH